MAHFQAERVQDYLGNPIESGDVRLTMAPVYVVGLSKNSAWYEQTAYSLETPHMVPTTAGDVVRPMVRVTNNRSAPIACRIQLALPEGWSAENPEISASVAPGKAQQIELPFTIAFAETLGFKDVKILVFEDEKQLKQMAVKVLVQSPLTVEISPMEGRPGPTQVTVHVGNRSAKAISGAFRMHLPDSWKALTPEIAIPDLKPQEIRPIVCKFAWSADWKPQENAQVELDFGADKKISRADSQPICDPPGKEHCDRRPPERLGTGDSIARVDAGFHGGQVERHGPPGLGQGRRLRRCRRA